MSQHHRSIIYSPGTGSRMSGHMTAAEWRDKFKSSAWLYNPWTGAARSASDVANDLFGLNIESVFSPPIGVMSPDRSVWTCMDAGDSLSLTIINQAIQVVVNGDLTYIQLGGDIKDLIVTTREQQRDLVQTAVKRATT